jgi:hypothetical protein
VVGIKIVKKCLKHVLSQKGFDFECGHEKLCIVNFPVSVRIQVLHDGLHFVLSKDKAFLRKSLLEVPGMDHPSAAEI